VGREEEQEIEGGKYFEGFLPHPFPGWGGRCCRRSRKGNVLRDFYLTSSQGREGGSAGDRGRELF